jgi:hypothetical protein
MNLNPKQVYSLCPACSACPTVEIHADGHVEVGEAPNVVTLGREEWNRLVAGVRSGELKEVA